MKHNFVIIGFISLLLLSFTTQAQSDSVIVVAPYKPSISEAVKINFNPQIVSETFDRPKMEYSITSKKISTDIQLNKIDQVRLKQRLKKDNLKNSHLKAGFGNYSTAYGELFVNSKQDEKKLLGLHLKHLSSSGVIKEYPKSSRSQNLVELYGARYTRTHAMGAELIYERLGHHFYGFKTDSFPSITDASIKQTYQVAKANLFLESNYKNVNKLKHKFELGYHYLFDRYNSAENHFYADFDLRKRVNWFKTLDNQSFGVEGGFEYYNSGDSVLAYNAMLYNVAPYMLVKLNPFEIRVGPKISVAPDFGPGKGDTTTYIKFYPLLDVKLHIVQNYLTLFAGLRGDYERIGYYTMMDENPYINPITPPTFTDKTFEAFGGIKASIGDVLDINAGIYNSNINNMIFFVIDSSTVAHNQFKYVVDSIQLTRIHGDINLTLGKDFELLIAGNYYSYSMEAEKAPWNRPEFDASLNARYTFMTDYTVKLKTRVIGKRPYSYDSVKDEIRYNDAIVDVGLGFEYQINTNFSAFVNVNNILAKRNYYWANYPGYRILALGGVKYSF